MLVSKGRLSEGQRTRYLSPYRLGQGQGGGEDPEVAGRVQEWLQLWLHPTSDHQTLGEEQGEEGRRYTWWT